MLGEQARKGLCLAPGHKGGSAKAAGERPNMLHQHVDYAVRSATVMAYATKWTRSCFAAAILALSLQAPAAATQTWRAVVRQDVADGFLNLRASPSTDAPVLARLLPGDFLEISTGQCDYRFNANREIIGNVCAPAGSPWVPVEYVRRFDDGSYSREEHGGWINDHYVVQARCGDEG
jgi:hypothetical protein